MAKKENYVSTKKKAASKKAVKSAAAALEAPARPEHVPVRKAKTHKGRRVLESREPQVHEQPKVSVIFKSSPRTSSTLSSLMSEINLLRKPHSVFFSHRLSSEIRPFEHEEELATFCNKKVASLFVAANSTKKRPDYITMGRLFNHGLLDLFEFSVQNFRSMREFAIGKVAPQMGSKPLVICQGVNFEASDALIAVRNMFADFFCGPKAEKVNLKGVDRAVVVTAIRRKAATDGSSFSNTRSTADFASHAFMVRNYAVSLRKSSTPKLPRVELVEIGPCFDLIPDRFTLASADTWKEAMKDPPEVSKKKEKNVTTNVVGERVGKIHVGHQAIGGLHTPHYHGIASERPIDD